MKTALLVLSFVLSVSTMGKPPAGGGKYASCQTNYNKCMETVFGAPGSQSYNVGKARCYAAWKTCTKKKSVSLEFLEDID